METEVGENGAREKIGKRVHKLPGMFILCHIHSSSAPPANLLHLGLNGRLQSVTAWNPEQLRPTLTHLKIKRLFLKLFFENDAGKETGTIQIFFSAPLPPAGGTHSRVSLILRSITVSKRLH